MSARPATRRDNSLGLGGLHGDGLIEGERAIEDTAGDLAAIGHFAQGRRISVDLIFGDTVSIAERDRDFRAREAECVRKLDGVLNNVNFVFERRVDVDGCISHKQRPRVVGSIDDEDVADPPGGPQLFLVDDRTHEFIGVEAALHQRVDLAIARQHDCLGRCRMAVLRRHKLVAGEVELGLFGRGPDLCLRPDQNWG